MPEPAAAARVDLESRPPTQWLLMELLAARWRLGDTEVLMPRERLGSVVSAVERLGLARVVGWPAPGVLAVALTEAGRWHMGLTDPAPDSAP